MNRYLYDLILKDLNKKMVVITGPRQVGKTFLAKQLMKNFKNPVYLNYDILSDNKIIINQSWPLNADLLIFDEIHKMKKWKQYLKGVYDGRNLQQKILITGSARMNTFRQAGDSLAGRYFHYKLNPLSVKELSLLNSDSEYELIEKLNIFSGFPEPYFAQSKEEYARWQNQYYTDLVREDILDFSRIAELRVIRLLLEMLRERVGSPISSLSLAQDLQVSPTTVRKYINILESLYVIFLVRPYHKNLARAILKEPKIYFYDSAYVKGDKGLIIENTCAVCLLKHIEFLHDSLGKNISLNYMRTKDGQEVDFLIIENDLIQSMIEVKLSDNTISKTLVYFQNKFPNSAAYQLVHNLKQEQNYKNINIIPLGKWLAKLNA